MILCAICIIDPSKVSCIGCLVDFALTHGAASGATIALVLRIKSLRDQLADFEAAELNKACATGRYRDNPNLMEFPEGYEIPDCCPALWEAAHWTPPGASPDTPGVCPEP